MYEWDHEHKNGYLTGHADFTDGTSTDDLRSNYLDASSLAQLYDRIDNALTAWWTGYALAIADRAYARGIERPVLAWSAQKGGAS